VKLNNTYLLFDSARAADGTEWRAAHQAIVDSIAAMRWPDDSTGRNFRIPRIVTVQPGKEYVDAAGKASTVKGKKRTLRNGVRPLRDQFRRWMVEKAWRCEQACSLAQFFEGLRHGTSVIFTKYPSPSVKELADATNEALNESVGDFDFWFQTRSGFRTVVEWETGNISSSHRSLNKMCLALMGGIVDAGVLIVPSKFLYPHLTDRIGNIRELQPYFYFWNRVGSLIERGLLAVVEVEHDELFKSTDLRDYVSMGADGNSERNRVATLRKAKSAKKR
jgi:hypothetical protein